MLDSGNWSDVPTPEGRVRTRALLEAMERLGYEVVNVGERDLRNGWETWLAAVEGRSLDFVSANILRKDTGRPLFRPSVVIESGVEGAGRRRVAVFGIARFNPLFRATGPDGAPLTIENPADALRREIAALADERIDLVVVLAAIHRDDALRLLTEVPQIDVIVGSYGGLIVEERPSEAPRWLLYAGNQGQRIGETRFEFSPEGRPVSQTTRLHQLTAIYPADPAMLAFVNAIPLGKPAPIEQATAPVPAEDRPGPFVGSSACRACHERQHAQWRESAHARSQQTLERAGKQGSFVCQTCHATAAGRPGGFVAADRTPGLAEVGCESCHGAGRPHLERTDRPYGSVSVVTCTTCHDRANSPGFDFYTYGPRIEHGRAE